MMAKISLLFAKFISLIPEQASTHKHTQLQQFKNASHQYSWFIKLSNNWHKVQSLDFSATLLVLSPSWASSFPLLISRTLIKATEPHKEEICPGNTKEVTPDKNWLGSLMKDFRYREKERERCKETGPKKKKKKKEQLELAIPVARHTVHSKLSRYMSC